MKIEINKIGTDFNKERCYVHARGLFMPDGFGIITTQKLELSGCDVFYGLEMIKTHDGGETFSDIVPCKNLTRRYFEDRKNCFNRSYRMVRQRQLNTHRAT